MLQDRVQPGLFATLSLPLGYFLSALRCVWSNKRHQMSPKILKKELLPTVDAVQRKTLLKQFM